MPPELPVPNLGSPRVKAALRVLGITGADLQKQDIDDHDGIQTRFNLFEGKRRTLVAQVTNLAQKGPAGSTSTAAQGEYPEPPPGPEERNAAFMEEVIRKEKEGLEVLAKMAKKDIQKVVIKELESKLDQFKGKKRQEENAVRVKELKKEQAEKLAAAQKEAAKKKEKTDEVRRRAEMKHQEHAEELRQTLQKADERVAKTLQKIKDDHAASIETNSVKMVEASERQAKFEQSQVRRRENMHDDIEDKHANKQELLQHLAGQRQSNKEAILEKNMKCKQRVAEHISATQAETEKKYWQIVDKNNHATEFREAKLAAELKEFKARNVKVRRDFESRYERVISKQERDAEKLRESWNERSLARSASETLRPRERAELLAAREQNENHVALVAKNRERIGRAHQHSVEQQIDKLLSMRERVQVMQDARAEADRRRMMVLRNTAIEKHHLQEKVDRFKDAGPDKMLKLLESGTEIEPEAAKRINELLVEMNLPPLGGYAQEEDK